MWCVWCCHDADSAVAAGTEKQMNDVHAQHHSQFLILITDTAADDGQGAAQVLLIHGSVCMRVGDGRSGGVGRGDGGRACISSVLRSSRLRLPDWSRHRSLHGRPALPKSGCEGGFHRHCDRMPGRCAP